MSVCKHQQKGRFKKKEIVDGVGYKEMWENGTVRTEMIGFLCIYLFMD